MTGAGRNPRSSVRGPSRRVEREHRPGSDPRAVQEVDRPLEVGDPVGRPRVERHVRGQLALDAERPRLLREELRRLLVDDELGAPVRRPGRRRQERRRRRRDVELATRAGRHHADAAVRPDGEVGVAGRAGDAVRDVLEEAGGGLLRSIWSRGDAVGGERQEARRLAGVTVTAAAPIVSLHGLGQDGPDLRGDRDELRPGDDGRVDRDRQRRLLPLEAGERGRPRPPARPPGRAPGPRSPGRSPASARRARWTPRVRAGRRRRPRASSLAPSATSSTSTGGSTSAPVKRSQSRSSPRIGSGPSPWSSAADTAAAQSASASTASGRIGYRSPAGREDDRDGRGLAAPSPPASPAPPRR